MILSLFDRSGKITTAFKALNFECYSLDIHPGHASYKVDIQKDILCLDHKSFFKVPVTFMFIALPCETFSKASGGFHFKKGIPQTKQAQNAILILDKIFEMIDYFKCDYLIENPSGGLIHNPYFNKHFKGNITRLTLQSFGFPTQKQTDLFYNFDMLLMHNPVNRVNGRYNKTKLTNMTYSKRIIYPEHFINFITENISIHLKNKYSHVKTSPH